MLELALNLIWVSLALPAYLLWRSKGPRSRSVGGLLVLSCCLALLFPVISATDDLHAMRPEIEESGPGKRSSRHSITNNNSTPHNFVHHPTQIVFSVSQQNLVAVCGFVCAEYRTSPASQTTTISFSRAPPFHFLG